MSTDGFLVLDSTSAFAQFGEQTSERGRECVEQGGVAELFWPQPWEFLALVEGADNRVHRAKVSFNSILRPTGEMEMVPLSTSCTCDVKRYCEHAAAALHILVDEPELLSDEFRNGGVYADDDDYPGAVAESLQELVLSGSQQWRPPDWRMLLDRLQTYQDHGTEPLAIGVSMLSQDPRAPFAYPKATQPEDLDGGKDLSVILMPLTKGKKGTWIKGGLTWDSFTSPDSIERFGGQRCEIMASIAERGSSHLGYSGRRIKELELEMLSGATVWPLLDRVRELGIPFIGQGIVQDIQIHPPVSLLFSLEKEDGCIHLLPIVQRDDGSDVQPSVYPLLPIGDTGFVDIQLDPTSGGHRVTLALLPLREPLTHGTAGLINGSRHIHVPPEELPEFTETFLPVAMHLATICSRDQSVEIPEATPPRLWLRAHYGPRHELTLDWGWHYDHPRRIVRLLNDGVIDGESATILPRDRNAERMVLQRVREIWPSAAYGETMRFTGIDTARFTVDVLPLLEDSDDVVVEIAGLKGDYAELEGAPLIRVGADETEDRDWYDLRVDVEVAGRMVPFRQLFTALAQDETHLLLPDGAYFPLDHPDLDRLRQLISEADALNDERPRLSRYQTSLFDEFGELAHEVHAPPSWQRLLDGLRDADGIPEHPVPETVQARLRPYQVDGYQWLSFLAEHEMGGILADDMGLGKTLQTLTFITHARGLTPEAPPFLVVAPTSVASNWVTEAAKFTPHLNVCLVDSTARRRGSSLEEVVQGADVVVTSYAILRIDAEDFAAREWSGLLLDEAQSVKNHVARTHQAARGVQAPFRLAITGTPMENSLTDLWSLLSLAVPGLFPSLSRFKRDFVKPIESGEEPERMAVLRRRIRPFMMRRTKDLVAADLPEKLEQLTTVTLEAKHRKLYDTVLQRERKKVLGLMADFESNRIEVLSSLTRLRMLALDPAIVDGGKYQNTPSSKMEALIDQLQEAVAEGHRVIVFSQFTSFLKRLAVRLNPTGVRYAYLDGTTRRRGEVIRSFTDGTVPVFLISLKAGGTGLTLTEADYVFLLDPWWNPAVEAQAVDRAHRIGQTSTVMVYRMVAEGTIEEKVLALQRRKAELFTSLMDDGAAFGQAITAEDIRELLEES